MSVRDAGVQYLLFLSAFRTSRWLLEWLPAVIGAGLAGPRSARRPIPDWTLSSQLLARLAQKHEKHAQRLDPGYQIMGKKKKEKHL